MMIYLYIFHAGEPTTSGVLLYEVSYAGTHPFDSTYIHDLCEETSCPVPVGNFLVTHKTTVPPMAPSVSLTLPNRYTLYGTVVCGHSKNITISFIFSHNVTNYWALANLYCHKPF